MHHFNHSASGPPTPVQVPSPAQTSSAPPLPPGWIAQFDQNSQRWFFVQTATGFTQWDPPMFAPPPGPPPPQTYYPPPPIPAPYYEGHRGFDPNAAETGPQEVQFAEPHVPEAEVPDAGPQSASSKMGVFLKESLNTGLVKSKLVLEHSLGLGHRPNAVPPGEASIDEEPRLVEIGWHPVGGFGGKWFAEKTGLGKKITEKINKYPDPTQHWAVLVDEYAHELWMDEHLDVIYINEKINRAEWHTFSVGKTRFNDEALRQAGEMVIHNMRATRPAYNIISNNCQNFAVALLDAIQVGAHAEFATSFAVYQRATGKGKIIDLFVDKHPDEKTDQQRPELHRMDTVQTAAQVMEAETTKLDNHRRIF
ncbi:hypothetical protein BU16DRAFT_530330 [Lophium mytilinum]|uniref:WW domain-containing protein n=1 Tax=Lophium mytilinum TaxID=390894 RepID=A0A6A6QE66_9PEZI|nr:hypothetical protein BU16DRAFT_530330 [Lophium mytilinum]